MKHRLRVLGALLAVFVLPLSAAAQTVVWTALDVQARLDNDGRLHVVETHHLQLMEGGGFKLTLPFGLGVDQQIVFRSLTRLGPDGAEVPLEDAEVEKTDQYRYYPLGHVYFSIPEVPRGTAVAYRMEYELLNALSPAWALGARKGPLVRPASVYSPWPGVRQALSDMREAWALPDRLYRLDHDVLFPSRQGPGYEVRRIDYQLQYDTAWKLVNPEAELAEIKADDDYRVRQLFERVDGGVPSAVDMKVPRLRWLALAAILLGVPGLWLLLQLAEGLGQRLAGSVTVESMNARLSTLAPEAVAVLFRGGGNSAPSLESVLSRMSGERKIAIEVEPVVATTAPAGADDSAADDDDDEEPTRLVRLRRLVPLESLPDFERELLNQLLVGGRRDVTSAQLQDLRAERGLEPWKIVGDMLPAAHARKPPRSLLAGLLGLLSLGGVVLQVSSLSSMEPIPVAILADVTVLMLLRLWPRGYWHGGQPWSAALALLVPGLFVSAAAMALLFSVSPPMPVQGFLGTALAAVAAYGALLALARRPWRGEPHATVRELGRIRRYADRELRRGQPRLEDRFVPHLEALGLGPRLEAWRQSAGNGMGAGSSGMEGDLAESSTPLARPFTARPAVPFAGPPGWTDALYVPSAEERAEMAEEQDA